MNDWSETQALREGWVVFDKQIEPYRRYTTRFGKPNPFMKMPGSWDEYCMRALAFVQRKAAEGSAYHIDALARTQLL